MASTASTAATMATAPTGSQARNRSHRSADVVERLRGASSGLTPSCGSGPGVSPAIIEVSLFEPCDAWDTLSSLSQEGGRERRTSAGTRRAVLRFLGRSADEPDVRGTRPRTGRRTGSCSLRSACRRSQRARSDRSASAASIVAGLLSAVLLFAFWTSRVSRRVQRIAVAIVVVTVLTVSVALALGSHSPRERRRGGGGRLPHARGARRHPPPAVVARRDLGDTVAGAACAYLLIGIFFMSVFTFLAATGQGPFFAQTASERSIDHLYFSFVIPHDGRVRRSDPDRRSRAG